MQRITITLLILILAGVAGCSTMGSSEMTTQSISRPPVTHGSDD
jgi:hypothetical protein